MIPNLLLTPINNLTNTISNDMQWRMQEAAAPNYKILLPQNCGWLYAYSELQYQPWSTWVTLNNTSY